MKASRALSIRMRSFNFILNALERLRRIAWWGPCDLMYIFKSCVAGEAARVLMVPSLDSMG